MLAFVESGRRGEVDRRRKSRLARTRLDEQWSGLAAGANRYGISAGRYAGRASTNASVGRASGPLVNASPPVTFTRREKDDLAISLANHLPTAVAEESLRLAGAWTRKIHRDIPLSTDRIPLILVDLRSSPPIVYRPRNCAHYGILLHTPALTGAPFLATSHCQAKTRENPVQHRRYVAKDDGDACRVQGHQAPPSRDQ